MKFIQLGNGSAFNTKMTNSSFMFKKDEEYLLVDCGYSVFAKLDSMDESGGFDFKQLKTIFITHMDDDHIGSLRALMYRLFFEFNIVPTIVCDESIENLLKTYLINIGGHNGIVIDYKKQYKELFKLVTIEQYQEMNPVFSITAVKNKHYQPGSGICVHDKTLSILITGDTIANQDTLEAIKIINIASDLIVFHDYSAWNSPSQQVHACKANLEKEYPKIIINNLNYYHNNKPYLSGWFEMKAPFMISHFNIMPKKLLLKKLGAEDGIKSTKNVTH